MTKQEFKEYYKNSAIKKAIIPELKERVAYIHDELCNQKYDCHNYSFHLFTVLIVVREYAYQVCEKESDILPILFAALFHDSIEDARQTYNDVMRIAKEYMSDEQALMATEIVYTLTDEKGRTRAERANDKHFEDIRNTKYAPFVKWCDRYCNMQYSISTKSRMADVYRKEMPSFIEKLGGEKYLSKELVERIINL